MSLFLDKIHNRYHITYNIFPAFSQADLEKKLKRLI